jgi:spore coat polysaccharide biosynthesis predicted glycosyltransferase SpsG/L-amino acid N-acyltransferase YncA
VKVLLFAEGSRSIGVGHQVRSAALAGALLRQGHEPALACRALDGSAHPWAWAGLTYTLAAPDASTRSALFDARGRERPDVVVVDHAGPDEALLGELARETPLALIDDVPSARAGPAHVVVNSAPGLEPSDYPGSAVSLGPAYALVRPEFSHVPALDRQPAVLVALGSARTFDSDAVLEALLQATPLRVDWVGAPPSAAQRPRVSVLPHQDASGMASLMARSSLGVLSASSVCLEAACARLPFVAIETAPDQQRLALGLASLEVPVLCGGATAEGLRAAFERAARARLSVDGRGAERVAARVVEAAIRTPSLGLRSVVWRDAPALLALANDPEARRGSFSERVIGADEHVAWLAGKLVDPEARLFVAEEGELVGSGRLERAGGTAVVSLAVAPGRRGSGVGGRMLSALREWSKAAAFVERLLALVREDNAASLRLFERAGYARTGSLTVEGRPAIRFEQVV